MYISPHKILGHMDRVAEWLERGESVPINVQLSPYDAQCNHGCPACVAGFKGFTGAVMAVPVFTELAHDLKTMGVRSLTFTGGSEPLLHPEFDTLASVAAATGLQLGLITNGSLVPESRARLLVEAMAWVRVSLDAASESHFLTAHGAPGGAFRRVVENVRRLVAARRALREASRVPGATLGIGFLTSPREDYIREIVPAVHLARELEVDYIQFRPLLRVPHGPELDWTAGPAQRALLDTLEQALGMSTPVTRVISSKEKYDRVRTGAVRPYTRCHFVHFAPAVSASGTVSLCCHHMENDDFLIGNVTERPFREIWSGERKRAALARLPLQQCPLLCRGVGANELLDAMVTPLEHGDFL